VEALQGERGGIGQLSAPALRKLILLQQVRCYFFTTVSAAFVLLMKIVVCSDGYGASKRRLGGNCIACS
jgi:hypothetical protein